MFPVLQDFGWQHRTGCQSRHNPQVGSIVFWAISKESLLCWDEGNKEAGRKGKAPVSPRFSHFLHIFASVYLGVVRHDECLLPYCKGEPVKEIRDAFGCIEFHFVFLRCLVLVFLWFFCFERCPAQRKRDAILEVRYFKDLW